MKKEDREHFRQALYEMGKRLKEGVADLSTEALRKTGGASSGGLSNTPTHPADLGTDAYQQELALSMLETEQRQLEEVAAALERFNQGTYGRCESCGKAIALERLRALPYARLCIDCAREDAGQAANPT